MHVLNSNRAIWYMFYIWITYSFSTCISRPWLRCGFIIKLFVSFYMQRKLILNGSLRNYLNGMNVWIKALHLDSLSCAKCSTLVISEGHSSETVLFLFFLFFCVFPFETNFNFKFEFPHRPFLCRNVYAFLDYTVTVTLTICWLW